MERKVYGKAVLGGACAMQDGSEWGKEGQVEAIGQLRVRPDQVWVHLANPTRILVSMHRRPPELSDAVLNSLTRFS